MGVSEPDDYDEMDAPYFVEFWGAGGRLRTIYDIPTASDARTIAKNGLDNGFTHAEILVYRKRGGASRVCSYPECIRQRD